ITGERVSEQSPRSAYAVVRRTLRRMCLSSLLRALSSWRGIALAVSAPTDDTNAVPAAFQREWSGGSAMSTRRHDHKLSANAHTGDAITMLQEDHQRVRDLFQKYDASRDPRVQRVIAEEACTELEIHTQMEEEIFYPAVAEAREVDRHE